MSIPEGYFEDLISDYDIVEENENITISIHFGKQLGHKMDIAQDALDAQVWQDVRRYMPIDTGALQSETNALNASVRGEVYMYPPNSDYGHYQYMGEIYVDPVYKCGGFLTADGWKSRAGIKKEPSGRSLKYSAPDARAKWGIEAVDNHSMEWIEVVKRALL